MGRSPAVQDVLKQSDVPTSSRSLAAALWDALNTPLSGAYFGTTARRSDGAPVSTEKIFQEVQRVGPDRFSSAKTLTSLVWRENWKGTLAYAFSAIQENAGFAVITSVVTWCTTWLDPNKVARSLIPLSVLAGYGVLRFALNSNRQRINETFQSAANRAIDGEVSRGVLSRALSTVRSPGYQSLFGSVQENTWRVLTFVQTNFAMVGSLTGIGISAFVIGRQDPKIATALLLVGVLEIYHSLRANKAYLKYEVESAEPRAQLRAQRGFAKTVRGIREFMNLLKAENAVQKVEFLDKEVERKNLARAKRHAYGSMCIGLFPLAVEALAVGDFLFGYLSQGIGTPQQLSGLVFGILAMEWSMTNFFRTIGDQITNGTFAINALSLGLVGRPRHDPSKRSTYERLDVTATPRIDLRNVSYFSESSQRAILSGVTCAFLPGKVYGVCGDSGSGKTSLLRLLTLEVSPSSGSILFDNKRIESVEPDDICRVVGYLPQDYLDLETYTIREAIELSGRGEETKISLDRAARTAQVTFAGDVSTFDTTRIGTQIEGGREVSGGERHRIAMARVIYKDARVIVLDEPTSSLGVLTENAMLNGVQTLAKEKGLTVIIVSHRYSNLKNADRILFFDNGKIVERGTHERLMSRGGRYAARYELEKGGYQD